MATRNTQTKMSVPKTEPSSGSWPNKPTEDFLSARDMRNVKIYYCQDPKTGQIDNDRTLRTMFWLFNECDFHPTETLSAYMSILNVFTYPLFENMSSNLTDCVGIRFHPTLVTDLTWPKAQITNLNTPLSSDDRLAALAIYIMMLDNFAWDRITTAGDAILDAGAFGSDLLTTTKLGQKQYTRTVAFMVQPDNLPFTRYIYDSLLKKAAENGNKKFEKVLKFCGERLKTVMACKTILSNAN